MRVQRQVSGQSGEQMLAVGVVAQDGQAGQIVGGVAGHTKFAASENAVPQRGIETARQRVDGVSLRHYSMVHLCEVTLRGYAAANRQ